MKKNDVDILGNFDKDQPTFIAKNVVNNSTRHPAAVVAWLVERLLYEKCHLLAVDQIPLGDVYIVKIVTKKELWTRYRLRGL